jgi:hypothetical protein
MEDEMHDVAVSAQAVDKLVAQMKANPPMGSAPKAFCDNWDTAKQVLTALQPFVSQIPGVGIFAGPAISLAITAGDAAKKAFC